MIIVRAAIQYRDQDFVIGIAASGTTPYVIGGLDRAGQPTQTVYVGTIVQGKLTGWLWTLVGGYAADRISRHLAFASVTTIISSSRTPH